jgi:NADH:ubiquinone oxidoreductase subunit 4 (subunit M)
MDEGVLWVASQLRERGVFPADTYFKVSVYAGHGNPAGAMVLERLGAGSVNHASGTFDMREMGGLRKHMPWTYWTFVIGSLSLAGIWPLGCR